MKITATDQFGHFIFSPYVDEFDRPIERTPHEYPYSYDSFVIHRVGANEDATSTIYSDRILQWDYKKARKLMAKHFGESGDYWNNREPKKIEKFLREYCKDKTIEIVYIMEHCNRSSGYPLWSFHYKTQKNV